MRFQFSTRQILLATAFIAVICGGFVGYIHAIEYKDWEKPWWTAGEHFIATASLWCPAVFVAFAIGRRTFTARLVAACALTELAAVIVVTLLIRAVRG